MISSRMLKLILQVNKTAIVAISPQKSMAVFYPFLPIQERPMYQYPLIACYSNLNLFFNVIFICRILRYMKM